MENEATTRKGPGFDEHLEAFIAAAQRVIDEHRTKNYPNIPRDVLVPEKGRRYVRVWKRLENAPASEGRGCAYCFVDMTNGNVLKPDGWKKPAKGVRSNIFTLDFGVRGVGPYGAVTWVR